MKLSEEVKQAIRDEFNDFKAKMYAHKSIEERKSLDQFFTPPELTIEMIEMFDCTNEEFAEKKILDPTCGSGNLLVACLIAGASWENLFGNDYDKKMVEVCKKRLRDTCEKLGLPSIGDSKHRYDKINYHIHRGNALQKLCITDFSRTYRDNYDETYIDDLKYAQNNYEKPMVQMRMDEVDQW